MGKELTENKFVSIPNIVADSFISNDAKLLYGFIRYWEYYGFFNHSVSEIMDKLNCSYNSAKKYVKELESKGFIYLDTNNKFSWIIKPLINDEIIVNMSISNKQHNELNKVLEGLSEEEQQRLINKALKELEEREKGQRICKQLFGDMKK